MAYLCIKCKQISTRAVLPLSIEQDMARLLSNGTTSSSTTGRKMLPNRRAKSLDSIVIVDSEPPSPRCPSPTPSSGVDSNKDSPIQIENIDGSSIGKYIVCCCLTFASSYENIIFNCVTTCDHSYDLKLFLMFVFLYLSHRKS